MEANDNPGGPDRAEVNARLAAIIDSSDDAIIAKNLEGIITDWNHGAERIFGYTAAEMVGQPLTRIIPPDRLGEEKDMLQRIRRGERTDHYKTVRQRKDGTPVYVSVSTSPIRNAAGVIMGAAKIARDITLETELETMRQHAAAIIESSDDAIIGKDLNGIITSWNPRAERMFGYTKKEMIGQSILKLIPTERHAEEIHILERLRRGESVDHFETVRQDKGGQKIEVSLTISPIKNQQGKIVGASKIIRDITERKQAQQALREAQAQYEHELEQKVEERTVKLKEAIKELETFSYSISHDLRAPLRSMHQYAKIMLDDYGNKVDENGRKFIGKIISSADKLDALIRDVLTYSQVARAKVQFQPVDLEKLIHETISQYLMLQPPHAEVEIQTPLMPVLGKEVFLTQCISNLMGNAVKFVPHGTLPKVRLWTELKGEKVRLWVEDNGIGIAPAYQARIFDLFERLEPETSYEGTGIGLAIVRKAMERMDGCVGVESAPGKGSRFWLDFHPVAKNQAEGADDGACAKSSASEADTV